MTMKLGCLLFWRSQVLAFPVTGAWPQHEENLIYLQLSQGVHTCPGGMNLQSKTESRWVETR